MFSITAQNVILQHKMLDVIKLSVILQHKMLGLIM
jgi:hypothetical protein